MTTLLSRQDIERLLPPEECTAAVNDAFRKHALGEISAPWLRPKVSVSCSSIDACPQRR